MSDNDIIKRKSSRFNLHRFFRIPEFKEIVAPAVLVGIGTGLGAVLLSWLIQKIRFFAFTLIVTEFQYDSSFSFHLYPRVWRIDHRIDHPFHNR